MPRTANRSKPTMPVGNSNAVRLQGIQALGPLQATIMEIIWKHTAEHPGQPVTVTDVMELLHQQKGKERVAYTSVMTTMRNLADTTGKGFLRADRNSRAYSYVPVVSKEQYVKNIVLGTLEQFSKDYPTIMQEYLVRHQSADEFASLSAAAAS